MTTSLWQALVRDRGLALLTCGLVLSALLPITVTALLPFADLPNHVAAASLLWDTAFGDGLAAHHYAVQWKPIPYWTLYLVLALLSALLGPLMAAKIIVGICVVGMPLALMRLMLALKRDPRLGLWGFALSWEHNLFAGWQAYLLGMSLALVAIAWLLEAQTLRQALRVAVLALIVGLTHAQAVIYLGCAAFLITLVRRPFRQGLLLGTVGMLGLLITIVPWLIRALTARGADPAGFTFEFDPPEAKLQDLFRFTLDNAVRPADVAAAALAFAVLCIGPLLLTLLPQSKQRGRDPAALVLCLLPLVLYAALPMTIRGPVFHWYTYPRYASFGLLSLLLIPKPVLHGWASLALAPGLLVAVLLQARITSQLSDFATRGDALLEIATHMRPNSAYLPLEIDDADPVMKLAPYNQIHSYLVAINKGYDPHLFDNPNIPLVYRQARRLPQTQWNGARDFSLEQHGKYYDYVLVQGTSVDPVARQLVSPSARARLVHQAGRFRLYAIERSAEKQPKEG